MMKYKLTTSGKVVISISCVFMFMSSYLVTTAMAALLMPHWYTPEFGATGRSIFMYGIFGSLLMACSIGLMFSAFSDRKSVEIDKEEFTKEEIYEEAKKLLRKASDEYKPEKL